MEKYKTTFAERSPPFTGTVRVSMPRYLPIRIHRMQVIRVEATRAWSKTGKGGGQWFV